MRTQQDHETRVQISLIFGIFGFGHFFICGPKMGPKVPGRASIRSGEGFRFIWTKFQPKWVHLGTNRAPFCFSMSQKPILGPNSSKSSLGPGPFGPRAHPIWDLARPFGPSVPSNMGSRAHGGRRPTFRRGVGGGAPPLQRGGCGGAAAPPQKSSPWSYWQ